MPNIVFLAMPIIVFTFRDIMGLGLLALWIVVGIVWGIVAGLNKLSRWWHARHSRH